MKNNDAIKGMETRLDRIKNLPFFATLVEEPKGKFIHIDMEKAVPHYLRELGWSESLLNPLRLETIRKIMTQDLMFLLGVPLNLRLLESKYIDRNFPLKTAEDAAARILWQEEYRQLRAIDLSVARVHNDTLHPKTGGYMPDAELDLYAARVKAGLTKGNK